MLKRNKHTKTEKIASAVLSVILAMGAGCSAYGAEIDASIETEVDLYSDDIAGTAELASPPSPPGNNYTPSWSGANEITEETTATSPVYTSTEADQNALLVSASSGTVNINNPTVTKSGGTSNDDKYSFYGINSAVMCKGGGTTTITGGTINTSASGANGIFSYGANSGKTNASGDGTTVNISGTTITTTGSGSGGIMTTFGGTTNASDLNIETSGGSSAPIRTDRGGGWVNVTGGTYTSNGLGSPAIYSTADVKVSNAVLTSNKSEGVCIEGNGTIALTDCTLTASNTQKNGNAQYLDTIMIYQSMSGDATGTGSGFSMTGGNLNSKSGHVFHVTNTTATINLNGVNIDNSDSGGILLSVTNDGWSGNNNTATVNASSQTLEGSVIVSSEASTKSESASSLTLNLSNASTFEGKIDDGNGGNNFGAVDVVIGEGCTWNLTGDSYVTTLTNNGTVNKGNYELYVGSGGSSGIKNGTLKIGEYTYEYSYTDKVSYSGQKIKLTDLTIGGKKAGETLSGNVIFKSVKYRNNKKVGTASAIPVFKAGKSADAGLRSAVKSLNKSLKTSPLQFTVEECTLKSDTISGTAAYKQSSGKWSFSLKADTGGTKLQKLKYGRDFSVTEGSYNAEKATVQIEGKGNYTGTAVISSVQTK